MSDPSIEPGDPRYDGFRISELWAWTQIDVDDQEGIITLDSPQGPMPMIASDRVRLKQFRVYARMIAKATGRPVRLRRFVFAEDVETVG